LCVTKTNRSIFVQVINDDIGTTLIAGSTPKGKAANLDLAKSLGDQIAKAAIAKGIQNVVFDRSGNLYHGRVAAVAEGARAGGLKF
jgi:large subunit ribosomal protein L18